MQSFFKKYEVIVEQQGDGKNERKPIGNLKDLQKHPEFNGAVHVFKVGELDASVYFESISKGSFIKFAKNYQLGDTYEQPKLKVLAGGKDKNVLQQ